MDEMKPVTQCNVGIRYLFIDDAEGRHCYRRHYPRGLPTTSRSARYGGFHTLNIGRSLKADLLGSLVPRVICRSYVLLAEQTLSFTNRRRPRLDTVGLHAIEGHAYVF